MHSPAEWGAIVLGVLLIVNGVLWRQLHLRRKRRAQHAGLDNPDPAVRAAAVETMTTGGLSVHAAALEELIKTEKDPTVLEAVANAVFQNQWEPASVPAMIQLRIWASNRAAPPAVSEELAPAPAVPAGEPEVPSEEPQPEMPDVWSVTPTTGMDEALVDRTEPEPVLGTPFVEPVFEPVLEQSPVLEPGPVLELDPVVEPQLVLEPQPVLPEPVAWEEPVEPTERELEPERQLEPLSSFEPAPTEMPDDLVLEPIGGSLFGALPLAPFESIEPASPELVAASEPVAEAIARTLGTTVRSLRITTLEGVVTAQWPR